MAKRYQLECIDAKRRLLVMLVSVAPRFAVYPDDCPQELLMAFRDAEAEGLLTLQHVGPGRFVPVVVSQPAVSE